MTCDKSPKEMQTYFFFISCLLHIQATPKDKKASLVIHGLVDKVGMLVSFICFYFIPLR